MKHLRPLIFSLLTLTAMSLSALDLPIKTVNGRPYYYYEVKPKDDLYKICRQLGLTRTEVIRNNPSVTDGLRRGQTLYFPVESDVPVAAATASETVHLVKKGETLYGIANLYGVSEDAILSVNPGARGVLKQGTALVIPTTATAPVPVKTETPADTPATAAPAQPGPAPTTAEPTAMPVFVPVAGHEDTTGTTEDIPTGTDDDNAVLSTDTVRVTIMLPFMLVDDQPSKTAQLYTEFFKGFMLAADSLRDYGAPLVITALDTENSTERVSQLLTLPVVRNSDLIIGPDNETQLNTIADFARGNGINLLNIFAVKNQAYVTNPFVLQANIPHTNMYRQAVEALMRDFSEYTPVLLQPTQGKSDKAEFQQILRNALTESGRQYIDITYTGVLRDDDLAPLDTSHRYLFIPPSGTTTEFNRLYTALRAYKDRLDDMSLIHLFGYPEWMTFRQDMLDKVHYMNSTIYSRFYNDTRSPRSTTFTALYQERYGSTMLNAIPLQGILGFDSGMFVIKALNRNLSTDATEFDTVYDGIQCDYRFINTDGADGRINNTLYFVTFRPSGFIDKRTL